MIRVVVAEPNKEPEIREVDPGKLGEIVEGWLECVQLWCGLDCWINETGRLEGLAPNRFVRADRPSLDGIEPAFWDLFGTIVIADSTEDGETIGLTPDAAAMMVSALALNGSEFARPMTEGETPRDAPPVVVTFFRED